MIDVIAWKQSKGPKSGSEITQAVSTPAHTGPEGLRGGETTRQEPRNVCGRQSERSLPLCAGNTRSGDELQPTGHRDGIQYHIRGLAYSSVGHADPLLPFS